MELYCGIDCGGSKTLCVLADGDGVLLGEGLGGPSNHLSVGRETARASIMDSVAAAFRAAGLPRRPFACAYVASAAVEVHHGGRHLPFLSTCVDAARLLADNDAIPVWFSGAGWEPAVVALAGTGSVAYAFRDGLFFKAGGWGPLMGDEGSGFDIGRRALNLASRILDGRASGDGFPARVCAALGVGELGELHRLLREGDPRSLVASLAAPVCEWFLAGDPAAALLLNAAADELMLAVETAAAAAAFDRPVPLIGSGGLLAQNAPLYRLLAQRAADSRHIRDMAPVRAVPALAAAALALDADGRTEQARRLLQAEVV